MTALLFALVLSVLPFLAQAGLSCPSGSGPTEQITEFEVAATPDEVYRYTGYFLNTKWQGAPQISISSDPPRHILAFDVLQFIEELVSNWKSVNPVTFNAAAAQVRVPYCEQNLEITARCNRGTHSTGNWRSRLCVLDGSFKDVAVEWFETRHRNAIYNAFKDLGVQGRAEEQMNGGVPGCSAANTTSAPSPATISRTTASSSPSSATSTANQSPTNAVSQPTPVLAVPPFGAKTAGGHRDKANAIFALVVGVIAMSIIL